MVQDVVVEVENSGTLFCKAFFGCFLFLPLFLSFFPFFFLRADMEEHSEYFRGANMERRGGECGNPRL